MPEDHGKQVQDPSEGDVLAEKKLCRVFLGAVIICALIVWDLFFLSGRAANFPRLVRVSLLPILLWALTVTAYAFHALRQIAARRTARIEELKRQK